MTCTNHSGFCLVPFCSVLRPFAGCGFSSDWTMAHRRRTTGRTIHSCSYRRQAVMQMWTSSQNVVIIERKSRTFSGCDRAKRHHQRRAGTARLALGVVYYQRRFSFALLCATHVHIFLTVRLLENLNDPANST